MAILLLVILIILWALGYIHLPLSFLNNPLFTLFGHAITLYDLLVAAAISWLISILPSPFRQIAGVLFLLWLLSFFGIIAIGGFSNIIVLALIIGLILFVLKVI